MIKPSTATWQQGFAYALAFLVGGLVAKTLPLPSLSSGISVDPSWSPAVSFEALPTFSPGAVNLDFAMIAAGVALLVAIVALSTKAFTKPSGADVTTTSLQVAAEPAKAASVATQNVDAVRDGLEKQLSQLLQTVSKYLESSSAQSEQFAAIQERLASADTVEKLQAVVEVLMTNSLQGQRDAEELRTNLKVAQTQTVALQTKLVKAEKLASLDALTSLPNRRSFEAFLEKAVEESHTDYTPLCVIMADIDHFKRINDKFGHPTGDAVLKQFARILSSSVRPTDMVARYGGEEFVLILKKTPMGNAVQVAERIRGNILVSKWIDPNTNVDIGALTASFGIAEINDHETAKGIVERADQRLYVAKNNGRNRVEICKPNQ